MSLTQAGDDGYMTARFLEYMEQSAYYIARDIYCDFPERDPPYIAMPELFDFIAGADTGAIIASTLIVPKRDSGLPDWQVNQYWAKTSKSFFKNNKGLWQGGSLQVWQ